MKEKNDDPPCCGRPTDRWQPAYHAFYFAILGNGHIHSFQWSNTEFDYEAWTCGNCFQLRSDAEQARQGIKEYLSNFHKNGTGD
jgi:hypothetical protein